MKKIEFELEPFKIWMQEYFKKNGQAPDISELKIKNGCPFNKAVILRNFNSYNDACKACEIPSRSDKSEYLRENLLSHLREKVFEIRTTDRDHLRKNGMKHDRSRYERLFGSWSNSLELAGITPVEKTLIHYFDSYMGESPIEFLKEKIGMHNEWTENQILLIERMKECSGQQKEFRNKTNYKFIKKNFPSVSIIQIAAGYIPDGIHMGRTYKAKDGHNCHSEEERQLDNWLFENNFHHKTQVFYPNSRMTCDFLVNNIYLEYAGFEGTNLKSYKEKIKRKINTAIEYDLKLIILYNLNENNLAQLQAALLNNEKDIELSGTPLEIR